MEFENREVGEKMSWKGFVSKLIEPDALGSVRSDLKKNSTSSARKRRKPPYPQHSAQRACEG